MSQLKYHRTTDFCMIFGNHSSDYRYFRLPVWTEREDSKILSQTEYKQWNPHKWLILDQIDENNHKTKNRVWKATPLCDIKISLCVVLILKSKKCRIKLNWRAFWNSFLTIWLILSLNFLGISICTKSV